MRILSFIILAISTLFLKANAQQTMSHYLITGTYTSGKSEGIYVYTFNSKDGNFKTISHVKTSNPSYLTVSRDEKFVFAVNENHNNDNGGAVSSFSFNKSNGTLTPINEQLSGGDDPCYIETDHTGKWIFVGNYSSGTLSVLPVDADGKIGKSTTTIKHEGTGVNKDRQERAHVHCTFISNDNKWLFVPDLGIDKVMIYAFDASTGKLTPAPQPFVKLKDGAGPRHITFHPNNKYAYVIEEMGGAVDAYDYSNGQFKFIQHIASVQANDTGFIGSADIHVTADGKFLYASNRGGFNTLAIYSINQKDGKLQLSGHQSTLGSIPRNFIIDPSGNFLLAANQQSDDIVIFKRNQQTGLLTDTGKRISVGNPVCLKWARK
ncbi:MAG: lactonase family protein [Agriterribacter sp.]